jgi:hypothetical protein
MTIFSRSRHDLVIGAWALAPAIGIPLLMLVWIHRINSFTSHWSSLDMSYSPLTGWMLVALFAVSAGYLIAIVVVVSDVWARPMATNLRIMWTVLALLVAPYAGVVYWIVHCRSDETRTVACR